ncbi:Coa6 protein [Saccharomycopsis crataegensis]|uniref:Coa6 protein n=1 Tax=Saccharomycopsis crataegensis TaxID=43959 RepID=A0AAV5QJP1_9ASCO|nr:Coa6 protein [Saccharomycopsis crataegensis]
MAWFGSSSEDNAKAPTRSTRKQCWDSRDKFFVCLDGLKIDNALDDSKQQEIKKHCAAQEKLFERDCAHSWVKYFKEQRFYAIKKERFIKEMEEQDASPLPLSGKK